MNEHLLKKGTILLDNVRVASPCHADWDAMEGNDQVRHCLSCNKNVYNLSEMTQAQAQSVVNEHEGKLCVRFYQRADGTMLTQDCPVGMAKLRRDLAKPFAWLAAGVAGLAAWGASLFGGRAQAEPPRIMGRVAIAQPAPTTAPLMGDVAPIMGEAPAMMMGAVAVPVPTPAPLMGKIAPPKTSKTRQKRLTKRTTKRGAQRSANRRNR